QLLEVNLELEGYEVKRASNGDEALKLVRSFKPDIVLLDVMMPKLDGREVCRRIKGDPVTADIPVVFLSARAQDMDVNSGLELGVAKDAKMKPRDVADAIVKALNAEPAEHIAAIEVAGPGFINIRLSHHWLTGLVREIEQAGEAWGRSVATEPEKIQVEFVSA